MKLRTFVSLVLVCWGTQAHAQHKIFNRTFKEVVDVCSGDVGKTQPCAVKKVFFSVEAYSLRDSGDRYPYHGSLFYAGFETDTWEQAQEYGFVQYLRGCTYETFKDSSGQIVKRVSEVVSHRNARETFVRPTWMYDATTEDPLYYGPRKEDSNLPGGRLALYQWTPKVGVYSGSKIRELRDILQLAPAKRNALAPRLFVTDTPSMAYFSESRKRFQNAALEFKMCLYRLKDIPEALTSETPIPNAIVCFDWDHQFAFDFSQKKYEHRPGAGHDPFCASQKAEPPAEIWAREVAERAAEAASAAKPGPATSEKKRKP